MIGGPLGLAPEVTERADLLLSFSKMTFPHQMMRIILLEQIYRSFRIMHGEPITNNNAQEPDRLAVAFPFSSSFSIS